MSDHTHDDDRDEIDEAIDRAARLRSKRGRGGGGSAGEAPTGPRDTVPCPACGDHVLSVPAHLPCDGDPEAGDACPECDGGPLEELPAYATRRLRCPDCTARW